MLKIWLISPPPPPEYTQGVNTSSWGRSVLQFKQSDGWVARVGWLIGNQSQPILKPTNRPPAWLGGNGIPTNPGTLSQQSRLGWNSLTKVSEVQTLLRRMMNGGRARINTSRVESFQPSTHHGMFLTVEVVKHASFFKEPWCKRFSHE